MRIEAIFMVLFLCVVLLGVVSCCPKPCQVSAPFVRTDNASYITQNTATLTGFINPHGLKTQWWFEWGITPSMGNFTLVKMLYSADNVSFSLANLQPGTKYYFRLAGSNEKGISYGQIRTFITVPEPPPPPPEPPIVRTDNAMEITGSSASLRGFVDPNYSTTSWWFEWGPTDTLGQVTSKATITVAQDVKKTISGLQSGKVYFYRIVAQNSGGISYGETRTLMTDPY